MRPIVPTPVCLLTILALATALATACSEQNLKEREVTDRFLQGEDHVASDVLFVVDDSASMAEEQERLARNFEGFLGALPESRADYQLGVITTSVDSRETAGSLVGGVISAAQDDVVEVFRAAVQVGTSGSRNERGLQAAAVAVRDARNPGFIRPEARLQVIVLSDEDDQSPDSVESYLGDLLVAGGEQGAMVHAIVGDEPAGCSSGTTAADAGTRYLDAMRATGGYRESICAEDYTEILVRIALELSGVRDTFYLTRLPAPTSIEVRVDDILVPNRDLDGWTYEVGDNAIVFHGYAIPPDGANIAVEYLPWMGDEDDLRDEGDDTAAAR
jgi:hypothetical protein